MKNRDHLGVHTRYANLFSAKDYKGMGGIYPSEGPILKGTLFGPDKKITLIEIRAPRVGYDKLVVDDADNLANGADAQGGEQDGLHPAAWPRGEGEGEKEEQLSQHEQVSSIFLNIE